MTETDWKANPMASRATLPSEGLAATLVQDVLNRCDEKLQELVEAGPCLEDALTELFQRTRNAQKDMAGLIRPLQVAVRLSESEPMTQKEIDALSALFAQRCRHVASHMLAASVLAAGLEERLRDG